jgi:hypothetical protein
MMKLGSGREIYEPDFEQSAIYAGVLTNLWLFLFPISSKTKRIFLGWVKEVRTTKS